jgi:hypothetical protein
MLSNARALTRIHLDQESAEFFTAFTIHRAVLIAPLQVGAVQEFGAVEILPVAEIIGAVAALPQESAAKYGQPPSFDTDSLLEDSEFPIEKRD